MFITRRLNILNLRESTYLESLWQDRLNNGVEIFDKCGIGVFVDKFVGYIYE